MQGITRIDWYIAKKFIMTFFLSLLLIIVIIIIFDLSEKIDYFIKNEAPLKEIIFKYYVNYIPYLVNMFASLFVFITVIFFTSQMASNSEIIAILSCGVSFHRMMMPYLATALLIALLSLGLNLFVIPRSNVTRLEFEAQYIKRHNTYKLQNIHYQISPGQFIYIESFSRWNNTANRFTIEDFEGHRLRRKVSAETAAWDSTMDGWHMRKVVIRDYSEGLGDQVVVKERMDTVIALKIKDLFNNEKTVESLTIRQLNDLIRTQRMRGDANVMYATIEQQRRLTMPFSAIILTIIGVSLSARKRRGAIGWNIGIGIALAFSYIFFLRISEMFVYTDTLPPWIAMWLPNVLFTVVAAFLYNKARK
ncbi:MAG: LptF/LptG family permease [Bacteroidales bacterium]|nr:LptF/LptG family permease [Bacteroidales bacterium]